MITKILLTFMSIQFILSPIVLPGASTAYAEEKCSAGQYFDSTLNRCVLSKETIDTKVSVQNCDGKTGDDFKNCFDNNAKEQVDKLQNEGKIQASKDPKASMMNYGIAAVTALGAAYYLFMASDDIKSCGSTSLYLLLGGGATTLLGEITTQMKYKKSLKKLSGSYKDRMAESSTDKKENIDVLTKNQSIAFDYQIDSEKARQTAHKSRAKTYNLAFGLYTAAAVASLYEAYKYKSKAECSIKNITSIHPQKRKGINLVAHHEAFNKYHYISDFTPQEVVEVIFREVTSVVFPSAHAASEEIAKKSVETGTVAKDGVNPVLKGAKIAGKDSGIGSKIGKAVKVPLVRAGLSGALAFYSRSIASDAKRRAKDSQERVKMIEGLKQSFLNSNGAGFAHCSDNDRTDPSKTSCYCYLEDGSKNPARETSGVCLAVFGEVANTKATDYDNVGPLNPNEFKGCFTKQKRVDLNCKCKGDAKTGKKDNCLNLSPKINLGQFANNQALTSAASQAGSFTSGNISTGQISPDSGVKLALNMQKAQKKLEKNPKTAKLAKKANKYQEVLKKSFENGARKALAKNPKLANIGSSFSSPAKITSPKEALKALNKDLKDQGPKFVTGKSLGSTGTVKKENDFDLDFDSHGEGGAIVDDEVAAVMKQKFKINDISENSHHNIFKIITNRYQASALRHFFDDSGTFKGEAANDTDINEK